jgi:hypothetical protein
MACRKQQTGWLEDYWFKAKGKAAFVAVAAAVCTVLAVGSCAHLHVIWLVTDSKDATMHSRVESLYTACITCVKESLRSSTDSNDRLQW